MKIKLENPTQRVATSWRCSPAFQRDRSYARAEVDAPRARHQRRRPLRFRFRVHLHVERTTHAAGSGSIYGLLLSPGRTYRTYRTYVLGHSRTLSDTPDTCPRTPSDTPDMCPRTHRTLRTPLDAYGCPKCPKCPRTLRTHRTQPFTITESRCVLRSVEVICRGYSCMCPSFLAAS